jgi:hypothetical protein
MVDFGQYTYQYRKPESYTLGPALRAFREQNQNKERMDNQNAQAKAQQSSIDSRFAATFAQDRNSTEHNAAMEKYKRQATIADAGRKASWGGDANTARGLGQALLEAGGTFTEAMGSDGQPQFTFQAPSQPQQSTPDFQGARDNIFGAQGPKMGQPHQMPSPAGPGGSLLTEQSPFGPRDNPQDRLPGMSAELAGMSGPEELGGGPAVTDAAPMPEELGMGSPVEQEPEDDGMVAPGQGLLEQDPGDVEPSPSAGAQLQSPTLQNPFNTQSFSPYSVDMGQVKRGHQAQLNPLLQGIQNASPTGSPIDVGALNAGMSEINMPVDEAMKLYMPALQSLTSMANGQQAAQAAQGRLQLGTQGQANSREDKLRREAQAKVKNIVANDSLKETKVKLNAANGAYDLLDQAGGNPQAAADLIAQLYRMKNTGVMTDKDFERQVGGIASVWERVKNFTLDKLLSKNGGLNPDTRRNIRMVIDLALKNHKATMRAAASSMGTMYNSAQTPGERYEYGDGFRQFFDQEYWPQDMRQPFVDPNAPAADPNSPAYGTDAASDERERAPLPPAVSPHGTVFEPGRIGKKPPRTQKPIDQMNAQERKELAADLEN